IAVEFTARAPAPLFPMDLPISVPPLCSTRPLTNPFRRSKIPARQTSTIRRSHDNSWKVRSDYGRLAWHWTRYRPEVSRKRCKRRINYYRNEAAAKDTLAKVRALGSNGFIVQADVCHPEEISRMFRQVKDEFGALDIFVSN